MKTYPILPEKRLDNTDEMRVAIEDIQEVMAFVNRERNNDVKDFDNLQNRFIAGRKVGKVPSASNDVVEGDKDGDFNYDLSYIYILVGTAWRRAALGSF